MTDRSEKKAGSKHLHIICLDVPFPVDYGGVFDLFYKIKSLSGAGIQIHLHCFEYGRGRQIVLEKYCVEVNYYNRYTGLSGLSNTVPYIVASRANKSLLTRLLQDDFPILMEGIHCTYFLSTGQLPASRCLVRMHNVEFHYYRQLAQTTHSIFKKFYFKREGKLLEKYERSLAGKASFLTVTEKDRDVFIAELGYSNIDYLPLFLPGYRPEWSGEKGIYCLYHGNLSVAENEEAATWLMKYVFQELKIPLIIAGKNPSSRMISLAHQFENACIISNPSEPEMQELIKKAQVNVLPSLNETGIKLKLINALFNGRHCLVNTAGVDGTGLNSCCEIANSVTDMQIAINQLFELPFSKEAFNERMQILHRSFDNEANARQLILKIFKPVPATA